MFKSSKFWYGLSIMLMIFAVAVNTTYAGWLGLASTLATIGAVWCAVNGFVSEDR